MRLRISVLLLCLGAVAYAQSPADTAKIDEFRAYLKALEAQLTPEGVTNARTISTRLGTLGKQFKAVTPDPEPTPTPTPEPTPTYVTKAEWDLTIPGILKRLTSLEGAPAPTPTPTPTPEPSPTPTPEPTPIPPPSTASNGYYDALCARPDVFKCYSLRDPKQLAYKDQGGFSDTNSTSNPNTLWITYDPAADAAKVTIPAFAPLESTATLAAPVDAAATVLTLTDISTAKAGVYDLHAVRVGGEVMTVTARDATANTLTVARGKHGTIAAAHPAGALVEVNTNSVGSMIRLPLGTTDGHAYFFVWDALWTGSYLNSGLMNHKAFQFQSGGNANFAAWFEPQIGYDGAGVAGFSQATAVAVPTARSYQAISPSLNWADTNGDQSGPPLTAINYMLPRASTPQIKANTWCRFFVRIEQRASDYDLMKMWVSCEGLAPVLLYDTTRLSVRSTGSFPNSISAFWVEFNTSQDTFTRTDQRDLISYVKNVVALEGPLSADWTALLQVPVK